MSVFKGQEGYEESGALIACQESGPLIACCHAAQGRLLLMFVASSCRGLVMCVGLRTAATKGAQAAWLAAVFACALACLCAGGGARAMSPSAFERQRGAARRRCQAGAHGHTWCLDGWPSQAPAAPLHAAS